MGENDLDTIVADTAKKDIKLGRIALTTLGYGVVGALFDDATVIAPITAAMGLGLSLYDELKHTGMNLVWPALGIFTGGLLGSAFNADKNEHLSHFLSYSGATFGAGLGIYKSYISREKPEE